MLKCLGGMLWHSVVVKHRMSRCPMTQKWHHFWVISSHTQIFWPLEGLLRLFFFLWRHSRGLRNLLRAGEDPTSWRGCILPTLWFFNMLGPFFDFVWPGSGELLPPLPPLAAHPWSRPCLHYAIMKIWTNEWANSSLLVNHSSLFTYSGEGCINLWVTYMAHRTSIMFIFDLDEQSWDFQIFLE